MTEPTTKYEPSNGCSVVSQSLGNRLARLLFPSVYLAPMEDEDGYAQGDLGIDTFIYLDYVDRLRMVFSGKARLQMRLKTDVLVSKTKTTSNVYVLAPWEGRR